MYQIISKDALEVSYLFVFEIEFDNYFFYIFKYEKIKLIVTRFRWIDTDVIKITENMFIERRIVYDAVIK
jgi:hypothetical protein